ncbi:hypothetical protein ATN84_00355 [Paramesorhizobium deserti]|uniref:Uncharacterized protein n=1 Tax=Paramesorhizobium deserti TaxID=1494590 RepID=A0A135HYP8_9HYPH|nr:DUF5330 domain-containing protein [Paramesorhizobium deserti]KXF78293.1 hypothetical protein ATN84_00355 [Paramesorhizobium deserti]
MRFLMKMAFWLTLAFVVLPHTPLADLAIRTDDQAAARRSSAPAVVQGSAEAEGRENAGAERAPPRRSSAPAVVQGSAEAEGRENAGALETLFAAQRTLTDLGDFCTRNPSVCEAGSSMLSSLGLQAKDGAHIAHEYLNGQLGGEPAASAIASKLDALRAKMPETPKHGESIPVPTSRDAVTDALHTGTVKHGN